MASHRTLVCLMILTAFLAAACSPPARGRDDRGVDRTDGGQHDDGGFDPDGGETDGDDPDGGEGCGTDETDCDGVCVDTHWDDDHCGTCNFPCEEGQSCRSGLCQIDECAAGCPEGYYCHQGSRRCFEGCDADLDCPQPGSCNTSTRVCECASGHLLCGDTCVQENSLDSCGSPCQPCEAPLNGSAQCVGGECVVTCNLNHTLCNGVCLRNDSVSNCGGGCHSCPTTSNGVATCDGASCGLSCNLNHHRCGDSCVPDSSPNSCGASCSPCPVPANGSATCDGFNCGISCNAGYAKCGSNCVAESASQCGDSCSTCSQTIPANAHRVCSNGECDYACNEGWYKCGTGCCRGVAVAAGNNHTCAILAGTAGASSGRAKCWGSNVWGQLGRGSGSGISYVPVDVVGLTSNVTALSAGRDFTCAIRSGGLQCWGSGSYGVLGNGSSLQQNSPVAVTGLTSGVAAVAAGNDHACAVTTSGALRCWGRGLYGRLGTGNEESKNTPQNVYGAGVAAVAAGGGHTCAVLTDGTVHCWGYNHHGQLGTARTNTTDCGTGIFDPYCRTSPAAVSGVTGATAVAAGENHTCVIVTGGKLRCWGSNSWGQLGLSSSVDSTHVPTDVPGLSSGVVAVSAKQSNTCVRLSTGGIRCFGYNDHLQAGTGSTARGVYCGPFASPDCSGSQTTVVGFGAGGASQVAVGVYHACAVGTEGALSCWGSRLDGKLGTGAPLSENQSSPVPVTGR